MAKNKYLSKSLGRYATIDELSNSELIEQYLHIVKLNEWIPYRYEDFLEEVTNEFKRRELKWPV